MAFKPSTYTLNGAGGSSKVILARITVQRGLKEDLPKLHDGELAYCTDTNELFIGDPDEGNRLINDHKNLDVPEGVKGEDGKSLEFVWVGTKLGVRVKDSGKPFEFVDLSGEPLDIQYNKGWLEYKSKSATSWIRFLNLDLLIEQKVAKATQGVIPTGPLTGPTGPTTAPTGPTGATTDPTGPTTDPTGPTGPTTAPTGPTGATTDPTGPTGPTTAPTGPTGATTDPTGPTGPTTAPTGPTGPTTAPTGPTADPGDVTLSATAIYYGFYECATLSPSETTSNELQKRLIHSAVKKGYLKVIDPANVINPSSDSDTLGQSTEFRVKDLEAEVIVDGTEPVFNFVYGALIPENAPYIAKEVIVGSRTTFGPGSALESTNNGETIITIDGNNYRYYGSIALGMNDVSFEIAIEHE